MQTAQPAHATSHTQPLAKQIRAPPPRCRRPEREAGSEGPQQLSKELQGQPSPAPANVCPRAERGRFRQGLGCVGGQGWESKDLAGAEAPCPCIATRSGREAPDGILQINTINWGSIKSKPPVQGCSQTHRSHRYWESVVGMGESAGVQGTYKGQGLPP